MWVFMVTYAKSPAKVCRLAALLKQHFAHKVYFHCCVVMNGAQVKSMR